MAPLGFIASTGLARNQSFRKLARVSNKSPIFVIPSQRARASSSSTSLNMVQVVFNDVVIAEADTKDLPVVDGNYYFPPSALKKEHFDGPTSLHTTCSYKGVASYYTLKAGGKEAKDAAWFYPKPMDKYTHIADHVAFYKTKVTIK